MGFKEFVKNDFAKLGKLNGKKVLKTVGIIGGIGLAAVNMLNDRNDREVMKNEITDEILKKLKSGEN